MLRLVAIVAVLGAFGAALYFGGDTLEAWETPEPSQASLPAPETKRKSKPKRRAQPAKNASRRAPKPARRASKPRKRAWLIELNALCRQSRIELEEVPSPSGLSEVAPYLREAGRLNRQWNEQGIAILRRGGNAAAANELRELFDRDEAAVQTMLTMAEKGQYQQLATYAQSLVRLARAENRVLKKLGAADCTVSPDEFRLYEPAA
jgi:hypothetical protein